MKHTSFFRRLVSSLTAPMILTAMLAARASDVTQVGCFKGQSFLQAEAGLVYLNEDRPLTVHGFVMLSSPYVLTNALVFSPEGDMFPVIPDSDPASLSQDFNVPFEFLYEMDSAFPNGTYRLTLFTVHDGIRILNLVVDGDAYPNVPFVTNYQAAQAIDPTQPFVLAWEPFAGGTANDFVQVMIEDDSGEPLFESASPGAPGGLNGTATSLTIPADTLAPGQSYVANVLFAKINFADTTSYPGAVGIAGYYKETEVNLATLGVDFLTPPSLQDSSPNHHQEGVSRHSAVAFTFNKPMRTGISIQWSDNLVPSNFRYTWDASRRTLYCVYQQALPASESIFWTLNPAGSSNFKDQAGYALPTVSGEFTTSSDTEFPPDVQNVFLVKGLDYLQTGAQPVALGHYFGGLSIELNSLNTVTNGAVALASGFTSRPQRDDDGRSLGGWATYASAADLDKFLPDGDYTLTMDTAHDSTRILNLTLTNRLYPNAPTIQNFAAAQMIDPGSEFLLQWEPFQGGTSADLIMVEINNDQDQTVWATKETEAGDPNGTATSAAIPAGTFYPGRTYRAQIMFIKVADFDLTSYPGVPAAAVYIASTRFTVKTSGTPMRPRLEIVSSAGSLMHLRIWGEPGRMYAFESNANVNDPDGWNPEISGRAWDGSFDLFRNVPPWEPAVFFRGKEILP